VSLLRRPCSLPWKQTDNGSLVPWGADGVLSLSRRWSLAEGIAHDGVSDNTSLQSEHLERCGPSWVGGTAAPCSSGTAFAPTACCEINFPRGGWRANHGWPAALMGTSSICREGCDAPQAT
jgi:hypothetical protein